MFVVCMQSGDALATANIGGPGIAASGFANPAEPPPAGCGSTSKPESSEVRLLLL